MSAFRAVLAAPERFCRAFVDQAARPSWRDEPPGSPIPFVASTPGRKRDGLDLRASGWRLEAYKRNPTLLWHHQHSEEPLGHTDVRLAEGKVKGFAYFDDDERSQRVERKYRKGSLSAFSVGWNLLDADGELVRDQRRLTAAEIRDRLFYELTEISAVPVGADEDARVAERALAMLFGDRTVPAARWQKAAVRPAATTVDAHAARALLDAFPPPETVQQRVERLLPGALASYLMGR